MVGSQWPWAKPLVYHSCAGGSAKLSSHTALTVLQFCTYQLSSPAQSLRDAAADRSQALQEASNNAAGKYNPLSERQPLVS